MNEFINESREPSQTDIVDCNQKSIIKHLVISGGSVWGFSAFGIIYEAISQGIVQMSNIESIFMTSVGSIIGTMVSLKIPPDILLTYLIKRPWETLCKNNRYSVLDIYDAKGIIHCGFFENMFEYHNA
jgi:hypothetical protein